MQLRGVDSPADGGGDGECEEFVPPSSFFQSEIQFLKKGSPYFVRILKKAGLYLVPFSLSISVSIKQTISVLVSMSVSNKKTISMSV